MGWHAVGTALWVLAWALLAAWMPGCGGGVGTGGTGTFASGPITGLGSIWVGGIRFDDASASVVDDDGRVRSRSELRLGMTVEVDAGELGSSNGVAVATARTVRLGSEITGPLESTDPASGTLTVLGQRVEIGPDTVIDPRLAGGLARLVRGQRLDIHALHDAANGRYRATRIEPVDASVGFRLRGVVSALDSPAAELRIGGGRFVFSAVSLPTGGVAAGTLVRMRLAEAPDAQGRWVITAFSAAAPQVPAERDTARLEGPVTRFASATSFQVNGVLVDAATAAFPDGTAGLGLGARVEVQGAAVGGVLRASRVEIKGDALIAGRGFDLEGAIDSVDTPNRSFVLRSLTIGTARSDLRLDDGTLADLQPGRRVEVRAVLNAERTALEATRIRFVR